MASKKKAKAGVLAAGNIVRDNEYLHRLVEDEALRESLRDAFESARKAYGRMANGKGPTKALLDDKKTQKELQNTAASLRAAAEGLRGRKKRKRRRGGLLMLLLVGGVAALFVSEDLRKKALDLLFGKEEEFEYTSTTTPAAAAPPPPPPAPTPPTASSSPPPPSVEAT